MARTSSELNRQKDRQTHAHNDAGNDNTRRLKLASDNKHIDLGDQLTQAQLH